MMNHRWIAQHTHVHGHANIKMDKVYIHTYTVMLCHISSINIFLVLNEELHSERATLSLERDKMYHLADVAIIKVKKKLII